MVDRPQFSIGRAILPVAALSVALGTASRSPLLAGTIAAASVGMFLASLHAGAKLGFALHSVVAFLVVIAATLFSLFLGTTILSDPGYSVGPSVLILTTLLVLIGGATMRYFGRYRAMEMIGGLALVQLLVIFLTAVTSERKTFWWSYATALILTFDIIVLPMLAALACPAKKREGRTASLASLGRESKR